MPVRFHPLAALSALLVLGVPALRADEGMWTFDNVPVNKIQAKYGFTPDQAWLDHVRLSALRFPHGTGSFVSADGLVLTNHHVGHDFILQVSSKEHDYIKDGFVARARTEEIRVPGLELKCLVSCENITAQVLKAQKAGKTVREASEALAKEEAAKTGLSCEAVNLYQGGQFWVYRYRVFTDIRLVMAPEYDIAAFGKDWDNFTYPRHDMDFSMWRVYENGQPFRPEHFLKWTEKGAAYGDLTFVVGNPGRTSRLETLAQIEYKRDVMNPLLVRTLDRQRKALHAFAARDAESARLVSADLMSIENAYKVYAGETSLLKAPGALDAVHKAEERLKGAVAKNAELSASAGESWTRIVRALKDRKTFAAEELILVSRNRALVRGPVEGALRLVRAGDDTATRALPDLDIQNLELEIAQLASGLKEAVDELGSAHPLVKALLGSETPEGAARRILTDTKLLDPVQRKALQAEGERAVAASNDPLLVFARTLSPWQEKVQDRARTLDATIARQNQAIAQARFAVYGTSLYPDATFTLRLSYGALETYPQNGTLAQPFTTFGGLFDRADAWGPKAESGSWALPARWLQRRGTVNPSTPYNFITTNDIIGGNSGSPVLDRNAELVGLAFDGNSESHLGRFTYNPANNRCLCVDARAILEALAKVYDAPALVSELQGR
ncbi:MAG TPA: S46 family peptidase [Holophaga sp.]|nr:S46 family peptidase [Holophaga sp.]